MATIYKRTRRRPIPVTAEITTRSGKRCATWTDGRTKRTRRAPLSDDGRAILLEDGDYTIEYFDHNGQRRRVGSKTPDKDAAKQLANHLETEAMKRQRGLIDVKQERLTSESQRPIEEQLKAYAAFLTAAKRSEKHVAETGRMIRAVADRAGLKTVGDIDIDPVVLAVEAMRGDGNKGKGLSSRRVQALLTAFKSFTRWMVKTKKLSADPLFAIEKPSPAADRRKERRMLLPTEWFWLRNVTLADDAERFGMTATERTMLYAMAVQTGLRANELRSMTREQLFLTTAHPYVTCKARSTKNRQDAQQHINADLVAELKAYAAKKIPGAKLFAMPGEWRCAKMLRTDLAAARKAWLGAAEHDPDEYDRRKESDFLLPENHAGKVLDFHALRHTCGAWLALSGAQPNEIKAIMRHCSITLSMDTYGHLLPTQEADAVARLPNMLASLPEALAATGMDDSLFDGQGDEKAARKWAHLGQQLGGERVRKVATAGENMADGIEESHDPKVLRLNPLGEPRRRAAKTGKVVGGGVEPPTRGFSVLQGLYPRVLSVFNAP